MQEKRKPLLKNAPMFELGKKDKITSRRLMKYQTNKNQIIFP